MLPLFFYIKFPLQMKSISIFICVFILFSLFFSCQNIENENVIARVGNCELTTFDYSKTYSEKILNTGIVDSDFERERHLNQLIRLKLSLIEVPAEITSSIIKTFPKIGAPIIKPPSP